MKKYDASYLLLRSTVRILFWGGLWISFIYLADLYARTHN